MSRIRPYRKDLGIPDYDYGDDLLYHKPKPKKQPGRPGRNDTKVLLAMCLFSFLVLGTFVAIQMIPGMQFKLGSIFSLAGTNEHPGYTLGNVKLGTTIDILRVRHPNAQKASRPAAPSPSHSPKKIPNISFGTLKTAPIILPIRPVEIASSPA